jgi:hypothetical protein
MQKLCQFVLSKNFLTLHISKNLLKNYYTNNDLLYFGYDKSTKFQLLIHLEFFKYTSTILYLTLSFDYLYFLIKILNDVALTS